MQRLACGYACATIRRISVLSGVRYPGTAAFLALAFALLAPVAPVASAAPSTKKSIWGPVTRDGVSQFPIYRDLGVGIWQYSIRWDEVAPERPADPRNPFDPAYRWPLELDTAVAEAQASGIRVSVMLLGAPRWANGGREWQWAPTDPSLFADFAEAAARRWPAVRHWMIWSEPTKALNFQPLVPDNGRPLRGAAALEGPRTYARLLDATYARLHALNPRMIVIGGNTFTTGTVRPLRFIQAMRTAVNGRPPRMDMWGHNPFSLRRPVLSQPPLGSGYADFGDLDTLTGWLDKYLKRRGKKKLRLFLSEYSLPTDRANFEFNFFLTRARQADWIRTAYRTARAFKRIYTLGYLGLYDDPPRTQGDEVLRGLLDINGQPKPSYAAYKGA